MHSTDLQAARQKAQAGSPLAESLVMTLSLQHPTAAAAGGMLYASTKTHIQGFATYAFRNQWRRLVGARFDPAATAAARSASEAGSASLFVTVAACSHHLHRLGAAIAACLCWTCFPEGAASTAAQPPAAWWAELLDSSIPCNRTPSGTSSIDRGNKRSKACVLRESLRRVARLSLLCRFFYDHQPLQFSLGGFCCIWTARVRTREGPPPYLTCSTPAPQPQQLQHPQDPQLLLLQKELEASHHQELLSRQQQQLYRVTPETKIRLSLHPEAELYAQQRQQYSHQEDLHQHEENPTGLRRLAAAADPDCGKTAATAAASAAAAGLESTTSDGDAAGAYSELLFSVVSGSWLSNASGFGSDSETANRTHQQQPHKRVIFVPSEVHLTHATELVGSALGDTEENIHRLFEECSRRRAERMQRAALAAATAGEQQKADDFRLVGGRTLLFIDEIDSICPHRVSASEAGRRQVAALLSCMDGLNSDPSIFVVGATNHREAIDEAVRRAGRLELEIELSVPSAGERLSMLRKMLSQRPHCLSEPDIKEVADNCQAFVAADMALLMRTATTSALRQSLIHMQQLQQTGQEQEQQEQRQKILLLSPAHFKAALRLVRPSGLKGVACEVPRVRWGDIGGYEAAKRQLSECVEWPLAYGEMFSRLRLQPPKGILLYGPPGCSKTMLAKAVATESKMNFVSVKGPELFSKWVGESEKAVRDLFRRARQNAPCIIFFDEIDALGVDREKGDASGVETRVLSQLLTEMDGIGPHASIVVLAATNRPDLLDAALMRPGRLDRLVYVQLPDEDARLQIALNVLRHVPVHPTCLAAAMEDPEVAARIAALAQDRYRSDECAGATHKRGDGLTQEPEKPQEEQQGVPVTATLALACWLSARTEGYSGAEITMICKEGALDSIREHITRCKETSQQQQQLEEELLTLQLRHIQAALQRVKPRTPQSLLQLYEHYNNKTHGAASSPSPAVTPTPHSISAGAQPGTSSILGQGK
ncbi:uncharacterized protein LOC34621764 [Cyclospora cayetanensis]|uniref:Uncharacterized protein LOC34621764 n=1 Tax=Cyclospora cayetanensis TaxID=88456 RepID=A0A6P6RWK0_9EIME|nr:uncharacterized protein LOC34621764 [Cyclospora cayetanensis]